MSKTNIELAQEAAPELGESDPVMVAILDRFATLVEQRYRDKLLAGVEMPEPVGHLDGNDKLADFMSAGLKQDHANVGSATPNAYTVPVYTADQVREAIAAAVLKERQKWQQYLLDNFGLEIE